MHMYILTQVSNLPVFSTVSATLKLALSSVSRTRPFSAQTAAAIEQLLNEGGGRERGREGGERGEGGREGVEGDMTNLYHLPFHLKIVSSVAIRSEPHILQTTNKQLQQ
jgi:hypothetical protein